MAEKESPDVTFDPLPSPQDFCLTVPLYEQFRLDKKQWNPTFDLENYEGAKKSISALESALKSK